MYRGSPPYLPCDAAGTVLLSPSVCLEAVSGDRLLEGDRASAAVPPHLRLLAPLPPDTLSPTQLQPLPCAIVVSLASITAHALQDPAVRSLVLGHYDAKDPVMDVPVQDAHDRVCLPASVRKPHLAHVITELTFR